MAYLELPHNIQDRNSLDKNSSITKIMIFTEGTILGPRGIFGHFNHAQYGPIKDAVSVIKLWEKQGADITYLTSRKKPKQIQQIKEILSKYDFPGQHLYYRAKEQKYKDIVEIVLPDILIEDDCTSIGGKWQMCITYIRPEVKSKIKSIIVKEFRGIDHLPQIIHQLLESWW